jgi:hypothetical protein
MTAAGFLKLVVALWGDHWQQPCQALLAKHGHRYTGQTLWNWKAGKSPVPEHVELILGEERKARRGGILPSGSEVDHRQCGCNTRPYIPGFVLAIFQVLKLSRPILAYTMKFQKFINRRYCHPC